LRAEQCPWDAAACESAARGGHLDLLRWLHEQGCPWDTTAVRSAAAGSGHLPVLEHMQAFEPAPSTAQLTELLNVAGAHSHRATALWLRQQGARWPAVLGIDYCPWQAGVLQWAKAEGCTSPLWSVV
jgi:hypothetical protein